VSNRERQKGLVGEREIKHVFASHRWTTRGLEGEGDHIALKYTEPQPARQRALHVECKRQERLALPAWLRQAEEEAPTGTVPVVCFRQNRGQWYVCLSLADFLELVG